MFHVPKNLLRGKTRVRGNKKIIFLWFRREVATASADFPLRAGAVATSRLSFANACIRKSSFLNAASGYKSPYKVEM